MEFWRLRLYNEKKHITWNMNRRKSLFPPIYNQCSPNSEHAMPELQYPMPS
jgi:hypothetical protein